VHQNMEWATFEKLDNSSTLDFLSSLASIYAEKSLLQEREMQRFQQFLSIHSTSGRDDDKSFMLALADQNVDALNAFVIRFGADGLSLNHLRFSLKPLLSELLAQLAVWADMMLKKSELVFNRPFFVKSDFGYDRREAFAHVFFTFASYINDAMNDLKISLIEISTMRPSSALDTSGSLEQQDLEIAVHMGFSGLDPLGSFSRSEARTLQRVAFSLTELSNAVSALMPQLTANCAPSPALQETSIYCELLRSEVERFSGLSLPESSPLTVWEMRRQAFCFSMFSVGHILEALTKITQNSITPVDHKSLNHFLSSDVINRVALHLCEGGIPPLDAQAAAKKLVEYCLFHETDPATLIEPELKKIHPLLTPSALTLLQSLTNQSSSPIPGGQHTKSKIHDGSKKLRKNLSILAPFAAPISALALCFWSFSGCGVKTPIKSDIDDLRPPLPFDTTSDLTAPPPLKPIDKNTLIDTRSQQDATKIKGLP
jgi:hypothetical protein